VRKRSRERLRTLPSKKSAGVRERGKAIPVVVISAFRDLDEIAKEMAPVAHFKKR
jgi:hypothetical protein